MSTPVPVGFSQRLQLAWLEHTVTLVLAGHMRNHIVTSLQDLLRHELSVGGTASRGNREKAITMLLRIWVSVPRHLQPFRDEGLEHMQRLPVDDRLAVHWGMAMAVYPFFGAVAAAVGRLVRLQGTCAVAHVQRRLREQLGERETVARAVRRTLRCFVDWGTLLETGEQGVYQATPARPVQDKQLVVWLTEAALLTRRVYTGVLTALAQAPALFPFHLLRSMLLIWQVTADWSRSVTALLRTWSDSVSMGGDKIASPASHLDETFRFIYCVPPKVSLTVLASPSVY
jgi:hypothetical protein